MLKQRKELSVSQKQAVIKAIEKKDRDKRYIKTGDLYRSLTLTVRYFRKLFWSN